MRLVADTPPLSFNDASCEAIVEVSVEAKEASTLLGDVV
jgi:hypothetical protein